MPTMPIFTDNVPEVAVKGDLVVLSMESGKSVCTTLPLFRAFMRKAQSALAAHDRKPDNVIPLCELCISHNLPRD